MVTVTTVPAFTSGTNFSQPGPQVGVKIQLASDGSGAYVPVVALDPEAEIAIGSVSQEGAWTVQANAGTDLNTSALALEDGGNLATVAGTVSGGKLRVDPSGVTSPVSVASLPLPTNAAQETGGNLATLAGTVSAGKIGTTVSGSVAVTGTFYQATQPISAASLPLPTGAATSANQATIITDLETIDTTLGSPFQAGGPLGAGTNAIGGTYATPTALSSFAITPGASSTFESNHILKASAGNLYSLYAATTTAPGWLMTFNATSAPADGAVTPVEAIQIPAGSAAAISFDGAPPDYYSTGIVAVFSTTGPFTKTASATAFFKWRVQ